MFEAVLADSLGGLLRIGSMRMSRRSDPTGGRKDRIVRADRLMFRSRPRRAAMEMSESCHS